MVGTKNNRRVQYTQQAIKTAFLDLLPHKELAKITVTQICQQANINRGTFYLHYKDVFDLYQQIEVEWVQAMQPLITILPHEHLADWLKRLLIALKANEAVSKLVFANFRDGTHVNEIFAEVHEQAIINFKAQYPSNNPQIWELYFTYFVQGAVGTILAWFEAKDQITVDELAHMLANAVNGVEKTDQSKENP